MGTYLFGGILDVVRAKARGGFDGVRGTLVGARSVRQRQSGVPGVGGGRQRDELAGALS